MNYFTFAEFASKYKNTAKDYQAAEINSFWAPAASGDLDAYLAPKITAPFTPTPWFIKNLAIDLAYWQMTYKETNQELLKEDIDARIAGVLNGTIQVIDPTTNAALGTQQTNVFLTTSGTNTSFGMDRVENFEVDRSWQESFRDDRCD
jgi:phage gp36-like protein